MSRTLAEGAGSSSSNSSSSSGSGSSSSSWAPGAVKVSCFAAAAVASEARAEDHAPAAHDPPLLARPARLSDLTQRRPWTTPPPPPAEGAAAGLAAGPRRGGGATAAPPSPSPPPLPPAAAAAAAGGYSPLSAPSPGAGGGSGGARISWAPGAVKAGLEAHAEDRAPAAHDPLQQQQQQESPNQRQQQHQQVPDFLRVRPEFWMTNALARPAGEWFDGLMGRVMREAAEELELITFLSVPVFTVSIGVVRRIARERNGSHSASLAAVLDAMAAAYGVGSFYGGFLRFFSYESTSRHVDGKTYVSRLCMRGSVEVETGRCVADAGGLRVRDHDAKWHDIPLTAGSTYCFGKPRGAAAGAGAAAGGSRRAAAAGGGGAAAAGGGGVAAAGGRQRAGGSGRAAAAGGGGGGDDAPKSIGKEFKHQGYAKAKDGVARYTLVCDSGSHAEPPSPERVAAFERVIAPIAEHYTEMGAAAAWMHPSTWEGVAVLTCDGHPQDDAGAMSGNLSADWREQQFGRPLLLPKSAGYDSDLGVWVDKTSKQPLTHETVIQRALDQARAAAVQGGLASATTGTRALGLEGVERHPAVAEAAAAAMQQGGCKRTRKRKAADAAGEEVPASAVLRQSPPLKFNAAEHGALLKCGAVLAAGGRRFALCAALARLDEACGGDWCATNAHGGVPSDSKDSNDQQRKLYHAIRYHVNKYRLAEEQAREQQQQHQQGQPGA
ncbi:MAG: hypothetical protein J3K34DRAFT_478320 [Monoraphidium minutum]|nr:MAG: hypothetical protein J3K34DRAFT_478320 [Monoraphidium minutum]